MTETWTMRDGTKIAVKDMESSHIKNCMRMLEKKAELIRIHYANIYLEDIGEVQRIYELDDIDVLREFTTYESFEQELSHRGESN